MPIEDGKVNCFFFVVICFELLTLMKKCWFLSSIPVMVHFLRVVVKVAVLAIPGSLFYLAEMAPSAVGEQTAELKVIGGGMMN